MKSAAIVTLVACRAVMAAPEGDALAARFREQVRPFVETYCTGCHGGDEPKAELDLGGYADLPSVVRGFEYWELVLERLEAGEMPPARAERQPVPELRREIVEWIQALRRHEADARAGDPGPVLARRLSNAEYDYTIRDLTGVDLRPTREFPVDPANQAGFDNSGESLAMSPALLRKYLDAAQRVAAHLALTPDGFVFARHPMLVETDRDKYCVQRIVEFYRRQPTDYADYFEAAWRFAHREALGKATASMAETAAEAGVSARYLETLWSGLTAVEEEVGPLARLAARWRDVPPPHGAEQPAAVRAGCEALRDQVVELRAKLEWDFQNLNLRSFAAGGQAFIGWKNRQFATHRRTLNPETLQIEGEPRFIEVPVRRDDSVNGGRSRQNETERVEVEPDPDLTIRADPSLRPAYVAAFERFCRLFPDTFYRAERGRMHFDKVKEKQDKGRYLSAGFHNMMGYFRDDQPLCELILDEAGRRELDRLWIEFDFIARVPERQHAEFIFYERAETSTMRGPEFDLARSEDPDVTSPEMVARLAALYRERAERSLRENGGDAEALDAIAEHFRITNSNLRRIERVRREAEPRHLEALVEFAARAWRRPLAGAEREDLLGFYRALREERLEHEEAIRDAVASVLMSPHFTYRIDLAADAVGDESAPASAISGEAHDTAPLSDYALASRLSYFLWSSLPDAELLAHAAAGDLHTPAVLLAQTRRLLADDRVRALATEFGGNWLEFRRFEEHNAVDRERFPEFDDALREAMFEEPIRFLLDVVRSDRPVLDLLYAEDTFVNAVLARHYGMETDAADAGGDDWVQVPDASRYGRGGLLPMAVFLTQNAPGLRTSPVKRGYWVVRRVLGERIPPPPPVVPDLPRDEARMEHSLRDTLARHRADPACAGCHERFDALGLVFEGYGPVGERRTHDFAGREVDTRATFPDGSERRGLAGLRRYLREERQADFIENLCGKLFAYALGRTLILSDDGTLENTQARLAAEGYRFGALVESIVMSPQFLRKRVHP